MFAYINIYEYYVFKIVIYIYGGLATWREEEELYLRFLAA